MARSQVIVVMGSKSDRPTMEPASAVLDELGLAHESRVMSAHRHPELVREFATSAADNGVEVIIAGAGRSAHLPGVLASLTTLPVIGVPISSPQLGGMDALLSIVQMPFGVPVAAVGIDTPKNAALLAGRILALKDPAVAESLGAYLKRQAEAALETGAST